MLRQYGPQRYRNEVLGARTMPVGCVPLGSEMRLPITGERAIVLAWKPRRIEAWRRVDGFWLPCYLARGGHLAVCRVLRDGRLVTVAEQYAIDYRGKETTKCH